MGRGFRLTIFAKIQLIRLVPFFDLDGYMVAFFKANISPQWNLASNAKLSEVQFQRSK